MTADVRQLLLPELPDVEVDIAAVETSQVAAQVEEQESKEAGPEGAPTELNLSEAELEQLIGEMICDGEKQVAAVDEVYAEFAG